MGDWFYRDAHVDGYGLCNGLVRDAIGGVFQ